MPRRIWPSANETFIPQLRLLSVRQTTLAPEQFPSWPGLGENRSQGGLSPIWDGAVSFGRLCVQKKFLYPVFFLFLTTIPLLSQASGSNQDQIATHSRLAEQYLNQHRPDLAIP